MIHNLINTVWITTCNTKHPKYIKIHFHMYFEHISRKYKLIKISVICITYMSLHGFPYIFSCIISISLIILIYISQFSFFIHSDGVLSLEQHNAVIVFSDSTHWPTIGATPRSPPTRCR